MDTGKLFVYRGPGASEACVQHTLNGLRQETPAEVATLDTSELLRGDWAKEAIALVLPGGADLPYCKALNGAGNELIRGFVERGGTYLGLCAGAYYGSAFCDFERGHPTLEVVGPRELGFFPGSAVGAVLPGFHYSSQAGAGVCSVRMLSEGTGAAAEPPAGKEEHGTTSGRGAAYCNGGPAFVLPAAEAETSGGGGGGVPERVRVLCVYEGGRMPGMPAAVRCTVSDGVAVLVGPHPEFTAEPLERQWGLAGTADAPGAAAATSGSTGSSGCGCGGQQAKEVSDEAKEERKRRGRIAADLHAAEEDRRRFWRVVLEAARIPLREV